jgi:hypothetical protein
VGCKLMLCLQLHTTDIRELTSIAWIASAIHKLSLQRASSPRKSASLFAVVMAQLFLSPYSSMAFDMVVDSLMYSISSSSVRSTPCSRRGWARVLE